MNEEIDKIELRSEEFQEVLGAIPPWVLRWGILLIAVIIVILLIGSAMFKYPDTISSPVTLTSTTPVASIIAKTSGKIQELYIQDNEEVKHGDYLAIIENPAVTNDVLQLKKYISIINNSDSLYLIPPAQMQLGNLQLLYSSLYLKLSEYKQFIDKKYYQKKIDIAKENIKQNEEYYSNILRQYELVKEQHEISQKQYKRDSLLTQKGAFSKKEFENSYYQYLQSKLSLESMNTTFDNIHIQMRQLRETLFDTEYQYHEKKFLLETQLNSQLSQLENEIQAWEMAHVLKSPIDGKITFTGYWAENQNIISGGVVFNIIPTNKGEVIGKALLPTERSGKVEIDQKVNINFANFPDNEFGVIRGYVKSISLVPSKEIGGNHYVVEISLPNGLVTSYRKELPFFPEMEGTANIITKDLSLLQRVLLPIKNIITNGRSE